MGKIISSATTKLSGIGADLGAYALLLSVTIILQWWNGAFASEFGNHPDEAAHFITGLMAHDFLWQGDWLHPRAFAEEYYVHYPKVALGHWPPFFYLIQTFWMSVWPINRASMILLMAVLAAALAALVYREGRDVYGWWVGLGMGILLLVMPTVQSSSAGLMADILTALLCFQAARSFGRFLDGDRWQDSCAFGLWSALAILTKGTGFALALLPLPALLLNRRLRLLRSWKFWLPAAVVMVLCAPWYLMMLKLARNDLVEGTTSWLIFARNARDYSQGMLVVFGVGLLTLAFIGLSAKILRPMWRGSASGKWSSFGGWLIAFAIFHFAAPNYMEERFLLPILPIFVLAIAAGIQSIISQFPERLQRPRLRFVAAVTIATVLLAGAKALHLPRAASGYGNVLDRILQEGSDRHLVMLVSSDTNGDGMFVSEAALRDRQHNHFVLRASKVLSYSTWAGQGFRLSFANSEEVAQYLKQVPFDFIVLDKSIPESDQLPDHRQLVTAINSNPEDFLLVNTFPMIRNDKYLPDAIQVYRRRTTGSTSPRIIRIPMNALLGKTLEVVLP